MIFNRKRYNGYEGRSRSTRISAGVFASHTPAKTAPQGVRCAPPWCVRLALGLTP